MDGSETGSGVRMEDGGERDGVWTGVDGGEDGSWRGARRGVDGCGSRITPIPYHTHPIYSTPIPYHTPITPIPYHIHPVSHPSRSIIIHPVHTKVLSILAPPPPSSKLNENPSIGDAFGKKKKKTLGFIASCSSSSWATLLNKSLSCAYV